MNIPTETIKPRQIMDVRTYLSSSPEEKKAYLSDMISTIEKKYPDMDPGAKRMFGFFLTELLPIVSPSGGEKDTRENLENWSTMHPKAEQMTRAVDNAGNLLVTIAATPGYEDKPGILLQSHMDINCNPTKEQNPDISPEINPVFPVFDKGQTRIATQGTTLGADDRLGVAAEVILADEILNSDIPHGKIGLLFTTGEEDGLIGAMGFSFPKELLTGYKYLFNLDNEDSHEAIVGAAGGKNLNLRLPIEREDALGKLTLRIDLGGLLGGHSGADIHFQRLNAIKTLAGVIEKLSGVVDLGLVSLSGGTMDSSIPQRASAIVSIPKEQKADLEKIVEELQKEISDEDIITKSSLENSPLVKEKQKKKNKLQPEEPLFTVSDVQTNTQPMTQNSSDNLLSLIKDLPSGVIEVDDKYNIVKTSSNFGIITTNDNNVFFVNFARSSSVGSLDNIISKLSEIGASHNAEIVPAGKAFNVWEPDFSSPLLETVKSTHKEATGRDLEVNVIHAGLESHTIYEKIKEILGEGMPDDFGMVSLGPSMENVHTESEYFDILEASEFFPAVRLLLQTVMKEMQNEENASERRSTIS
ncbi:MAG TPA: M20/M25/M40 family metallo-hydrolase [Patescibacteria group bacterium]